MKCDQVSSYKWNELKWYLVQVASAMAWNQSRQQNEICHRRNTVCENEVCDVRNEICNGSSREIKLVTKAAAVHDMKFIVNVGSAMEWNLW